MSIEELLKEVREKPEIAKMLAELLIPYIEKSEILRAIKDMKVDISGIFEEQKRLREDFKSMFEEQRRLREDFNRLSEEQKRLREDFIEISREQERLRKDFNRMLEEIRELRLGYRRLTRALERLEGRMLVGFDSLRRFAGVSFEEFVREMLSRELQNAGVLPPDGYLNSTKIDGVEINLFYEDPLIVGEVTSYAESVKEIDKLLERAELAKKKYGREPQLYLIILSAPKKVAREIRRLAREKNINLIIGKEV